MMMCLSPLSRSSSSSSSYEKGVVMMNANTRATSISQSVNNHPPIKTKTKTYSVCQFRGYHRGHRRRDSPCPTASLSSSPCFCSTRVDIGGLLFRNKQEKQTNSFCLRVRFSRASISDFANYKDICRECVCVNKRALERVRVRRNCDDVSSEKFGFFFLSEITQPKKRHKK